jgi:hypothetical protein
VLSQIASTLSGATPSDIRPWNAPSFWEEARTHGVLPLAVASVGRAGWPGVDPALRRRVQREMADEVARAELAAADVRRVLGALDDDSVRPVVMKGAALAHTRYPLPGLRPRLDTDLLIRRTDVEAAHGTFRRLRAEYVPHVTGAYVMSQFHYVTTDRAGGRHPYDVHWRIVVPLAFARTLQLEEIEAAAESIPALGRHARAPSPEHALLLACVHRAAHHTGSTRLIWLYDMHLIAEQLTPRQQETFVQLAMTRGVASVAADGLATAHARFAGTATAALRARLAFVPPGSERLTRRYLTAQRTPVRDAMANLRALDAWRERLRLGRELLLPPRGYMRQVYAPGSRAPLSLLYLRRLLAALVR